MVNRVIKLEGRGVRGESEADILRRTGAFGVLPTDGDTTAMLKKNAAADAAAETAEAARDVALAAGVPYDDEAAFLAGTSSGERGAYWDGDQIVFALNDGGTAEAIDGPWFSPDKIGIYRSSTFTVTVPTDYATPQEAIDAIVKFRPIPGVKFTILLESGYVLPSGTRDPGDGRVATFLCCDGDYSHIVVKSEDATVTVAADFTGSVCRNIGAKGIVWGCLVDMDGKGGLGGAGYTAEEGSTGLVLADGSGVINSPWIGLYSRANSKMHAGSGAPSRWGITNAGVNFSGAALNGCYTNHSATTYCRDGDFSNCGGDAVHADHASTIDAERANVSGATGAGFLVSQVSSVNCRSANATGCDVGVRAVEASIVTAHGIDASGSSYGIYANRAAKVSAESANVSNCTPRGILAEELSEVDANRSTFTGCAVGVEAKVGSKVNIIAATGTGCGRPVMVSSGGKVIAGGETIGGTMTYTDLSGATHASNPAVDVLSQGVFVGDGVNIDDAAYVAVRVDGGEAYLRGASIQSAGNQAILARNGARVDARNADCTDAMAYAIQCLGGSIVQANGVTSTGAGNGLTNVAVNTLSSNGVVFQ